jgi:hypothetical protein
MWTFCLWPLLRQKRHGTKKRLKRLGHLTLFKHFFLALREKLKTWTALVQDFKALLGIFFKYI